MEIILLACVAGGSIAVPALFAVRWYVMEDGDDEAHDDKNALNR